MERSAPASGADVRQETLSLSSTDGTASTVPSETGTPPSGRRRKVKKYKLKKSLTADQVGHLQRILGMEVSDFEEVKERKRAPDEPKAQDNAAFWMFWRLYPRHDIIGAALKAWKALSPDSETVEKILRDVKKRITSYEWQKDGGKYIPYAHTYLNGQRWLDEGVVGQAAKIRGTIV